MKRLIFSKRISLFGSTRTELSGKMIVGTERSPLSIMMTNSLAFLSRSISMK